jgi:hypothetical protein
MPAKRRPSRRRTVDGVIEYHEDIRLDSILWMGVVMAIAGVVVLLTASVAGVLIVGAGLVAGGAVSCWFCSAHYEVSHDAVTVTIGPGRPIIVVATDEIVSAVPSTTSVWRSGGWGYRGLWRLGSVFVSLGGSGSVEMSTTTGKHLRLSSHHPDDLLDAVASTMSPPG